MLQCEKFNPLTSPSLCVYVCVQHKVQEYNSISANTMYPVRQITLNAEKSSIIIYA